MKRILIAVLFMLLLVVPVQSNELDINNMQEPSVSQGWLLINSYWKILELRYTFNELRGDNIGNALVEAYKKEMKLFSDLSESLSSRVIKALNRNNDRELRLLSTFYKSRQSYEQPAFELAVHSIISHLQREQLENGQELNMDKAQEYFPGYGYGDPKYIYRKGLEVARDRISEYWQEEERTLETSKHFEGAVEIELAAQLRDKVADFKQLSEPFKVNIGGSIKVCIKVSFTVKESLVTRAKKQYAVEKIWFELHRALRDFWATPKWEVCGRTYELHDEPTGFAATVEAKIDQQ